MALGRNKLEYEVLEGWEQLPEGWTFVEVAGVATDSKDRVYAFNRGAHPVIVFDRDGRFLNAWGEGVFSNAHGIFIGPDDRAYCADNFDHTVRIFTPDGTLLQTLGKKGEAADTGFKAWSAPVQRAAGPFNMVTNVALAPDGNLYVADGTATRACTCFRRRANSSFPGANPAKAPGSSGCHTQLPLTVVGRSMWPTVRTRVFKCSPTRGSTSPRGPT